MPEVVDLLMAGGAMRQSLHLLKKPRVVHSPHLIGFDSEYTQDGRTLTFQLADEVKAEVFPLASEPTLADLIGMVKRFQDVRYDRRPVYLLAFYSPAELGRLGAFWHEETCRFAPVAPGIWNVSFPLTQRRLKSGRWAQPVVTIFDVYHLAQTSLEKAADQWGLTKLKYDVTNLSAANLSDPDFIAYAKNDAIITREFFARLRDAVMAEFGIDLLTYSTVAGASAASYRKRDLVEVIGNPSSNVRAQAMRSYWGGHNLAYVRGDFDGPFYQGDAESLYPNSALLLGKLPRGSDWRQASSLDPLALGGCVRARFAYPSGCHYPGLPVFVDGKLIFPRTGLTDCTLAEARIAEAAGAELKVIKAFVYYDGDPTLARYLTRLIDLKREAEAAGRMGMRSFIKLMANAIVGKLGQHQGGVDLTAAFEFCLAHGVPIEEFLNPANFRGHPAKARYRIGPTWLPEWAALVLGMARAVMAAVLPLVKALNCTTDSFVCRLGDEITSYKGINFKPEGIFDHLKVYRTRLYYLDGHPEGKVKVAHHAIHMRESDSYDLMRLGEGGYTRSMGAKLPEAIRSQVPVDTRTERPMNVGWGWDDKRRLLPDGRTMPWESVQEYLSCKS